jgi:hypothetical protein
MISGNWVEDQFSVVGHAQLDLNNSFSAQVVASERLLSISHESEYVSGPRVLDLDINL